MGHYLGLLHTFSKQECDERSGDLVDDTPLQRSRSVGCPTGRDSCVCNSSKCDGADPVWNYLDYSWDRCMSRFTRGQVDRMWQLLATHRPQLLNHSFALSADASEDNFTSVPAITPEVPRGPAVTSLSSCESLGWHVSDAAPKKLKLCSQSQPDGRCRPATTHSAAVIRCANVGARLCTADELMANVRSWHQGLTLFYTWTSVWIHRSGPSPLASHFRLCTTGPTN